MRKIVWTYGIIAGLIMGAMFFITAPFWENGMINFDNGMWIGYTTMVVALSLIFFGVRSYRDQHRAGIISFGEAFKVGILIALVASFLYAASWEVAFHTVSKGFEEEMIRHYEANMKQTAATDAELKEGLQQIEQMRSMYANPLLRFLITLAEVLPVAIVMTLLSAALLKRKKASAVV